MDETKGQIFTRLKTRPDWPAIEQAKNDRIKALRDEGLRKDEASEQAWRELGEQYPPFTISTAEPAADETTDDAPAEPPTFSSDAEFIQGARWVYANLSRKPRQKDAPDDGAWALLQWAREFPNDFFKSIMPMVSKAASSKDEDAAEETEECEGVEALLADMGQGDGFVVQATTDDEPRACA